MGRDDNSILEESDSAIWAVEGRLFRGSIDAAGMPALIGRIADRSSATLTGHGALLAFDADRRIGLVVADRMGTVPLYYCEDSNGVVVSSRLSTVLSLLHAVPERNLQAIYDYLYFHTVPAPETIYAGVRRLLPGQVLRVEGASATVESLWQPEFAPDLGLNRAQAGERLRSSLDAAVARDSDARATGAFLSGGTDSSSITSTLVAARGGSAKAFSIGFDEPGYDETEFARIAASQCGAEHHEYFVSPEDVVEAVPSIAAQMDQPFGNASIVPAYYCARLASQQGIEILLGGDGGDELFGGNERYQKQLIFAIYDNLPGWIRRGILQPGSALLPPLPLIRKVRSYIRQASMGMPARMESYNLLERIGPATVLEPDFLGSVSTTRPMEMISEVYQGVHADGMINRMLGRDFKFTLADDDLVKVRESGRLAGIDVAFPFLDDAIVDLSLMLPEHWKVDRKALRPFFKEALSDRLPPAVIAKQKHGFGLPFGVWLNRDKGLRELAGDSLQALAGRGMFRRAFLDELMGRRLSEHSAYYGTLVWVLMMLEQWLETHPGPQNWQ